LASKTREKIVQESQLYPINAPAKFIESFSKIDLPYGGVGFAKGKRVKEQRAKGKKS
jgi:hypothetical protein